MAAHFLTLYSVRFVREDGTDRPLGNIDGNGTNLVEVVEQILTSQETYHDSDNERVLRFTEASEHPGTAVHTYLFKYGEYGTEFDVTEAVDLDAVNYGASSDESRTVMLSAALVAVPNRRQGWLVTDSVGRRISMASHLRSVLWEGMKARRDQFNGTFHMDPAHLREAWDLMMTEGDITGLFLHIPRASISDHDLFQELDLEELGRLQLGLKPRHGWRFKKQAADALRDLVEADELVVFRGPEPGDEIKADGATIEVEFRGRRRRLDVETDEAPVKIPILEATSQPPADQGRHEWMLNETVQLLQLLGQDPN